MLAEHVRHIVVGRILTSAQSYASRNHTMFLFSMRGLVIPTSVVTGSCLRIPSAQIIIILHSLTFQQVLRLRALGEVHFRVPKD